MDKDKQVMLNRRWITSGCMLGILIMVSHLAFSAYFEKEGKEITFVEAAESGNIKQVQKFLESGADVNQQDRAGITPLHGAAGTGHLKIAELLLAHHAKVDPRDNEGETPLFWASATGHPEIVKLLLSHHAEAGVQNKSGVSPLHRASGWPNEEIVQLLLANHAEVNVRDKDGTTPPFVGSSGGSQCKRQHREHAASSGGRLG